MSVLFSLVVTGEALRAKISLQRCQFDPKFQVEGDPHQLFLHG